MTVITDANIHELVQQYINGSVEFPEDLVDIQIQDLFLFLFLRLFLRLFLKYCKTMSIINRHCCRHRIFR